MQPRPQASGAGRDRAPGSTWRSGEVGEAGAGECRSLRPRPSARASGWGPSGGLGSGEDGPGPPHLLPLTLVQRPQRRVVEPEQQEAGPGGGGEAEPELPTQELLGSRHGRGVAGRHSSSHARRPPPTTFALQGATCTAGSPGRPAPAGTPPTGRRSPSPPAAWAAPSSLLPPALSPPGPLRCLFGSARPSLGFWQRLPPCQPRAPHPESPVPPQSAQQT